MVVDFTGASECPACGNDQSRYSSAGAGSFAGFDYRSLKCRSCGTVYVHPMPTPEILHAMYGPQYVDQHYSDAGVFEQEEVVLASELVSQRRPGGRLLDIGCGAGSFLRAATERGMSVEGFELNSVSAQRIASLSKCTVHAESLERITSAYDVVHLADVLEHLPKPLMTLREAVRLAGKSGLIVARGPLEAQVSFFDLAMRIRRRALGLFRPTQARVPPWHLVCFSLDGWHALAARAGLQLKDEWVTESQWPAPDHGFKGVAKQVSMRLSASRMGRWAKSGNRVLSVWAPL